MSLVESFVQVFEEIQSPIRLFDPRTWRFLLLAAPFIYLRPMTPCHCSDMELTLARFQLLKEQRKEDSLHCEQDMHLGVFAIASDLPSSNQGARVRSGTSTQHGDPNLLLSDPRGLMQRCHVNQRIRRHQVSRRDAHPLVG